MKATFALL